MILQRDDQTAAHTFGTVRRDDNTLVCHTLERPWLDNAVGVSCIPAGIYTAFRFQSPHVGYELFQLRDVPGRSGVDIHRGNWVTDCTGCVLLGQSRGTLDGQPAVLDSGVAFAAFMALMDGIDSFSLDVRDVR